jgi:hypothetical protein
MTESEVENRSATAPPTPWTVNVLKLLEDWDVQTFLRFAERAEQHRAAAENWAAIRREIAQKRALHPEYLAARGDPQKYLDGLRRQIDQVSAQSPEMGEKTWAYYHEKHGVDEAAAGRGPSEQSLEQGI